MTPEMTAGCKDSLRKNWEAFCDSDPLTPPNLSKDSFIEQMELAGLAELRSVEPDDLDDPFASERGIEPGGSVWSLTPAGRAALENSNG